MARIPALVRAGAVHPLRCARPAVVGAQVRPHLVELLSEKVDIPMMSLVGMTVAYDGEIWTVVDFNPYSPTPLRLKSGIDTYVWVHDHQVQEVTP